MKRRERERTDFLLDKQVREMILTAKDPRRQLSVLTKEVSIRLKARVGMFSAELSDTRRGENERFLGYACVRPA